MADLFDGIASPGASNPADSYSAKDIEVLEGLEPVRRRPGMYIGGTDERGLHHLAAEALDNAMDEAVAGFATRIELELSAEGWVTVRDNGRGIPVDPHPKFKDKSALEDLDVLGGIAVGGIAGPRGSDAVEKVCHGSIIGSLASCASRMQYI